MKKLATHGSSRPNAKGDIPRTRAPMCYTCEIGHFHPRNVKGMTFDYRDEPALVVEEELVLPTCDHCGEMRLSPAQADALDAALARAYDHRRIAQTTALLDDLKQRVHLRQNEIEHILGLSHGYVSKAQKGVKVFSAPTYRLLRVLRDRPRETLESLGKIDPAIGRIAARVPA